NAAEAALLFDVLRAIRQSGRSVLYVSHRLDEVMRLCDRVTVLRDGAVVGTQAIGALTADDIIRMMIGRQLGGAYPQRRAAPPAAEMVLEVADLAGMGVAGVDFAVRKGEIVGLAGLAGAGQSELLRLLVGAERAKRGQIRFAGRAFSARKPSI